MMLRRITRQVVESFLVCLGFIVFPFIPRRGVVRIAGMLGHAGYSCSTKLRKIAMANLDLAFGQTLTDAEKQKTAEDSFKTFALVLIDLFWFSLFSKRRIRTFVRFDPSFDCYFNTRSVIAVTGHIGNWEIMGQAAALHGEPSLSVAAPIENPFVDRVLGRMRSRTGQKVIFKAGAIRDLLKTLHAGGKVALLIDQNILPEEGGEFVNLFGLPVPISKAAGALSSRTGAKIVLTYCVADSNGSYDVYGVPLDVSGNATTQKIADAMESVIRKCRGQWLWMYKRWKYVPDNVSPDSYPFYARKIGAKMDTGIAKQTNEVVSKVT